MTLGELQRLIMRQAVLKLERLGAELAAKEAIPPAAPDPDKPARRPIAIDYLREEIAEQGILIAKLTYNHEREQAELERVERMQALEMSERLSRIGEIEHLIEHRDGVLAEFKRSNEIHKASNLILEANARIQETALLEIAQAIAGHNGGS